MPPAQRANAQERSTVLNSISISRLSPHGLLAVALVMWLALRSACGYLRKHKACYSFMTIG